jgi:hypothetical protein
VGSIATAGTGVIALIAIFPALFIYRGQSRAATVTAIRALTETVLRDSKQIYELTLDSVVAIAESQIQAFRNKLGRSATADTFCKYFYKETGSVLGSAFLEGSLASPAYARLSQLWIEIDQAAAGFRGVLRILFYAAGIIEGNSRAACYPLFSYSLADDMRRDPDLRAPYRAIKDLDELTLAVSTDLGQKLRDALSPNVSHRIYYIAQFVEDLSSALGDISDDSILRLSSDRGLRRERYSRPPGTPIMWAGPAEPISCHVAAPSAASIAKPPVDQEPAASGAPNSDAGAKTGETEETPLTNWHSRRDEEEEQEKINLDKIQHLLTRLKRAVPEQAFTNLNDRIEECKRTYDPDYTGPT